jgi:glycosyltransferase involved in cell wall biosynthesis
MAVRPDLSVIIPAVNGIEILLECLDALRANAARGTTLEILVIERCGDDVRRVLAERAPEAVMLPVPLQTTIPQMRALGFRHARADAVAVIEDHVLVPPDWARRLLDALAAGAEVVGGSVHNAATTTMVDRAAFLCEYSHMLAPVAGERVEGLTGNNVVYRRTLVERYSALLDEGRWEDDFHSAMRRDGVALTCRPDITVGHKMHYRMSEYVSQRYLYARAHAGMKRAGISLVSRALFTAGSFALPPLLLARIVNRVLASHRHHAELVQSLPLLFVFVSAWAAGEAVGYAVGPGDALARVR